MKIFLIAGEESGDILGADLMRTLHTKYRDVSFTFQGIGGARMEEQGMESLFPMQELSLMGIAEILPKLSHLLNRIQEAVSAIEAFQPDILITIDSPDFSFRVAKGVQKRSINVPFKVHYVAPTVWAWRPKRAQKVAGLYDAIFCLFPFEPPYFEKEGMKALFTGHPMSQLLSDVDGSTFLAQHSVPETVQKLCVLFGSRRGEVARMGPVFIETAQNLIQDLGEDLYLIVPTLPHLKEQVAALVAPLPCSSLIVTDKSEKYPAMAVCDAALATSGTVGLELSVLGVPHVIGYKMNALTHQIAARLVTTEYAHLTNIILQEQVVPEFIQSNCSALNLTRAVLSVIHDDTIRTGQTQAFDRVRDMIKGAENISPSERCADFLMQNINASS